MTEYIINKEQLHQLLEKCSMFLQPDEELMLVNNIDLRDFSQAECQYLSITIKNKTVFASPPEDLTEKRTRHATRSINGVLRQFLVREFAHKFCTQIKSVHSELQSRKEATDLTPDGIPKRRRRAFIRRIEKLLSGDPAGW